MSNKRYVVDTNVLVSAVAFRGGVPDQVLRKVLDDGVLVFSSETLAELKEVLWRPKFDQYIGLSLRKAFFIEIATSALIVEPQKVPVTCRDPKDQKFLEILIPGEVDVLISGDRDLLGIEAITDHQIMSPSDFMSRG